MSKTVCLLCGRARHQMTYSTGELRFCPCRRDRSSLSIKEIFVSGLVYRREDGSEVERAPCGRLLPV